MQILKLGVTGIYILAFGFLARQTLGAPRRVGPEGYFADIFVIVATAIIAFFLMKWLVAHWEESRDSKRSGKMDAREIRRIRKKLLVVGIICAVTVVVSVAVGNLGVSSLWLWYYPLLFVTSLAAAIVLECGKQAYSLN